MLTELITLYLKEVHCRSWEQMGTSLLSLLQSTSLNTIFKVSGSLFFISGT